MTLFTAVTLTPAACKLLAVPRVGVLNAPMGVLPRYRGMNVAEWAAWENGPLGATLHYMLLGRPPAPATARSNPPPGKTSPPVSPASAR